MRAQSRPIGRREFLMGTAAPAASVGVFWGVAFGRLRVSSPATTSQCPA